MQKVKLCVYHATSFKEKSFGLIGKDKPTFFFFKTRFGIHTFGLKFAIDIIVLNSKYEVVVYKQNLKPNRPFFWNPKYEHIIELPFGAIKKYRITRGTKIALDKKQYFI